MASSKKSKSTPVPVPGSKSKSKPQLPQSKLSNEFISESDDSGAEKTPSKPSKEKKSEKKEKKKDKEPVTIAVHRPKTNGVAKKAEVPIPKSKKSESKKAVSKKPESSSEESSEKSAKEKESPESESESEEEEETTKATKKSAKKAASSSSSSEVSSSEEESESESADEATPSTEAAPKQTQTHTVEFVAAEPFVPPKGFAAIPTPLNTSSKAAKMFENLEGKQIWHITTPAGVSLAQLKEIALDKALAGKPILSQKGTDYGFSTTGERTEEGACEVLVPHKDGYKAAPTRISRTLHLQQVINLPNLPTEKPDLNPGAAEFEDITKSSVKAPRPQLKGLKMRYFHSGFGDQDPGTLGMSDSEDEAPAPTQPKLNKPEKRRRSDADEASAKKVKKHRTAEEIKKREEKKAKKGKKGKTAS